MFQRLIMFISVIASLIIAASPCYSKVNFGYPIDTVIKGNSVQDIIIPGASLRTINGYQIPIKVGARSYFITGDTMSEIVKFLSDFRMYNVIAQTLGQNGHWSNTGGNIYLVIRNSGKKDYELIVKNIHALANKMNPIAAVADEIIGVLSQMDVIPFSSAQEIFSYITDYVKSSEATEELLKIYEKTLGKSASLFPNSSDQDISASSSKPFANIGFKDFKLIEFLTAAKKVSGTGESIKYIFNKIFFNSKKGLIGGELLNLKKGIMIEICSYPPVPNKAKGLVSLKSGVVTIDDIVNVLISLK